MTTFNERFSLKQRISESTRVRKKYPARVPVIVEQLNSSTLPRLDKNKYLVPGDLTIGQFVYILRKRIKLSSDQAIFVFINNTLPACSILISQAYKEYEDEGGFLTMYISEESTFGSRNF